MTRLGSVVTNIQYRIAAALDVDEKQRAQTVLAMIDNNARHAPGYWLQLLLSMGIATLGLVLNSTAVVIGAMLISPLMGPILEVGMGFAVGSPFLVLRAAIRVTLSIAIVIASAALLTRLLPIHEVTSEIAARTSPTALDLLVAVFCALAAAYTTVRPTSDTTAAAAGTAVGIALVPPLCACGFGIGTGSREIARGAALLFTANLSAILVFAVASFLLLGYNQVDADAITKSSALAATPSSRIASRAEATLHRMFGSRYGLAMRVMIPVMFLAAVFIPLRSALIEVSWEVRARTSIHAILSRDAPDAVQSTLSLERRNITMHLLVVGSNERAMGLEETIRRTVEERTGVSPVLTVRAVPDARTLDKETVASRSNGNVALPPTQEASDVQQRVQDVLDEVWPTATAGPLLDWELTVPMSSTPRVIVRHVGPELGPVGEARLSRMLSATLAVRVSILDAALSTGTATRPLGREADWLRRALPILEWAAQTKMVVACVQGPVNDSEQRTPDQLAAISALQSSSLAATGRLSLQDSAGWSVRIAERSCSAEDSTVAKPVAKPVAPTPKR
jgi:uncharacterized hydrophobic protein (TIGR00271 family)